TTIGAEANTLSPSGWPTSFYAYPSGRTCLCGKSSTSRTRWPASFKGERRGVESEVERSLLMISQRRVAIIGGGRMGREHARAATLLGARVSVLYDLEVANAQKLAEGYPQSNVVTDWREIDWPGVDAVFVCTPPSCRGPVECSAAEAGVPLFL